MRLWANGSDTERLGSFLECFKLFRESDACQVQPNRMLDFGGNFCIACVCLFLLLSHFSVSNSVISLTHLPPHSTLEQVSPYSMFLSYFVFPLLLPGNVNNNNRTIIITIIADR